MALRGVLPLACALAQIGLQGSLLRRLGQRMHREGQWLLGLCAGLLQQLISAHDDLLGHHRVVHEVYCNQETLRYQMHWHGLVTAVPSPHPELDDRVVLGFLIR